MYHIRKNDERSSRKARKKKSLVNLADQIRTHQVENQICIVAIAVLRLSFFSPVFSVRSVVSRSECF